jgi:branched-chain amino acid transport system ATP-binding protein
MIVDTVFETLEQLRGDGVTVLLVEQNATRAVEFADRCYVVRNGRVAMAGTRAELRETVDMAAAYLGV